MNAFYNGIGGDIIIKRQMLLVMLLVCGILTIGISAVSAENGTTEPIVNSTSGTSPTVDSTTETSSTSDSAPTVDSASTSGDSTSGTSSVDSTTETSSTSGSTSGTSGTSSVDSATGTSTVDSTSTSGTVDSASGTSPTVDSTTSGTSSAADSTSTVDSALTSGISKTSSTSDLGSNTPETQTMMAAGSDVSQMNWNGMQAYWMWASSAYSFDPWALRNSGITDIFLLTRGSTGNLYYTQLQHVIGICEPAGIRVHAWIVCFKDNSGVWVNPADESFKTTLYGIISTSASFTGVDGIHLDYARYPGTAYQYSGATTIIHNFVESAYNLVKGINLNLAVSAALMPECGSNAYYYGQDYAMLADHLDFLVPMIYKGNYGQNTAWIGSTTKWIVEHSGGKSVIAGIQNYYSDSNPVLLPGWELQNDINVALANGAVGYALFRYGIPPQTVSPSPSPSPPATYTPAPVYNPKPTYTVYRYKKWYKYKGKWRYKWVYKKARYKKVRAKSRYKKARYKKVRAKSRYKKASRKRYRR